MVREIHSHRDNVAPASDAAAPAGHVQRQASNMLMDPTINHGRLRELPSNPTAAAATKPMEIAGPEAGVSKPAGGVQHTRNKEEDKIINKAAHDLVDDYKRPNSLGPTDRTYHRLEGLIQNEYKEHGEEGLNYIEKSINYAFVKAQREGGLTGAPKTFEFGPKSGDLLEARVAYPDRPTLHHDDFAFHLTPPGQK